MALTYEAITPARYAAIVPATSPLAGLFRDVTAAAQAEDVSPLLLLAWLRSENNFATDISAGLLAIHNAAGIKYVGQHLARQSDQLPPSNEGGVYAAFDSWQDFFITLAINIKTILPDAWARGDLASIASYYTSGYPDRGAGANKVTFFNEYEGGSVGTTQVYGEDIIAKARQYIGQANSDGSLDPQNGVHQWGGWCEAFAEGIPKSLGLPQVQRASALAKLGAIESQGLLMQGTPEHGAWCLFGANFDPNGHICFWDADEGKFLGTLENPSSIGYHDQAGWMPAMAGWCRVPGVLGERRPAPAPPPVPVDTNFVPPNNRWNTGTDPAHQIGVGGDNKRLYLSAPAICGMPITNEVDAFVHLGDQISGPFAIQLYENITTAYDKAKNTLIVLPPGARIIPVGAR